MERTPQQVDFIDKLLDPTSGHLCLRARAGTGKTTTILEAVDDYAARHPSHELLICCFGKGIQREIEAKLAKRGHSDWRKIQASTSHSMGWGLVRFAFKLSKEQINKNKVRDIIKVQNDEIYDMFGSQIEDLVYYDKMEDWGFYGHVQTGEKQRQNKSADQYNIKDLEETESMEASD